MFKCKSMQTQRVLQLDYIGTFEVTAITNDKEFQ